MLRGESERLPDDVSRAAFVDDCVAVINQIGCGKVLLVGQSMGASTAMLTAAAHPDLVSGLVMIEGSPDGPSPSVAPSIVEQEFLESLSKWPTSFSDTDAAGRTIETPRLLIFGERGMFAPGHGDELVAELPTASSVTIAGAGHDVHLDAPQEWVHALGESAVSHRP